MTWRSQSGSLVIVRTDTGRAAPSTVHIIIVHYITVLYWQYKFGHRKIKMDKILDASQIGDCLQEALKVDLE